jgi:hypothetical protein
MKSFVSASLLLGVVAAHGIVKEIIVDGTLLVHHPTVLLICRSVFEGLFQNTSLSYNCGFLDLHEFLSTH